MRGALPSLVAGAALCLAVPAGAEPEEEDAGGEVLGTEVQADPLVEGAPADTLEAGAPRENISVGRRLLALGAALLPGVVVHGSGHWVLGRKRAAGALLAGSGIGFGMIVSGAVPLVASGASRYLTGPAATSAIFGVGLFGLSWLADVVGVAIPLEARGAPQLRLPRLSAELGYRYVAQPAFAFRHFAFQRLDLRLGPLRLSPEVWTAVDHPNSRLRLEGAYRMVGPRPDRAAENGSFLELRLAGGRHAFAPEGFTAVGAEVASAARLDMAVVDPYLRGAFFEAELGIAWHRLDYERADPDDSAVLLARFGYGVYLGEPASGAPYGELTHWYDQRHDDVPGGLTGRALGVPGHMGVSLRLWLHDQLGLQALGDFGAAYVGGLSVLMRTPLKGAED